MNIKSAKSYLLPTLAVFLIVTAAVVVTVVPKAGQAENTTAYAETPQNVAPHEEAPASEAPLVQEIASEEVPDNALSADKDGNFLIRASSLSSNKATFFRVPGDSRIELIARLGEDGQAKVALGTCQACGGSPRAYYTQVGDQLQCNNCGRKFPLTALEQPGSGCHPMMLDAEMLRYSGTADAIIDGKLLARYEPRFANVAPH